MNNSDQITIPSFMEALKFWIKLGFISFGGPAGQIAIIHEYLVDKKRWISESRFLHALNYCMLLPGPEAQQLATYTGWLLHGRLGGLAAGIFFVLPSMFILLALTVAYMTYGNIPWVYSLFQGLKPAVIAIVILALIKIGKKSLLSLYHFIIAIAAFVSIFFFNVSFPLIIVCAIIFSFIIKRYFPSLMSISSKNENQIESDEENYYINKNSIIPNSGYNFKRLLKQFGISFFLWLIPFITFSFLTSDFEFWKNLTIFFTQAAFVTFGGAYAVLPYVAQISVEEFGWLSNLQMIDGLALGETTPGPLVMVLVFVGFMAGYNHFGSSLLMGTLGLVTTTFYTFLPCFFFIFAGAPIIEKTQENKNIREILGLVTAAVVGVILNLTIYLGKAVIFPSGISLEKLDFITLSWIIISLIALYRFRINMITWIGISAAFGFLTYLFN